MRRRLKFIKGHINIVEISLIVFLDDILYLNKSDMFICFQYTFEIFTVATNNA